MLNVSAKWQRAVMLDNDINVNCFADIVTASGEKIPVSDSELWANGFEVNDSTSSNGTFTIGALVAGKLKIKLNNIYEDYSKYDFDKASVTAYVSKSFSDGTSEKLKIGEYRVSETSYDGSLITLTCLDNINNFNREYDSNLSYPTTAYEVVRDACIKCDVPFTMARFDNSDYVINEIPSDNQKLTYGQAIAYILQLSGLWGKCGHDGELLIGWYDMSQFGSQNYNGGTFSTKTTPYSDGDSVDGGTFKYSDGDSADGGTFTETRNYHNIYTQKDLNVATDDVVITGVKVIVTSKEDKTKDVNALAGKEGYVVSISDNPFISADKAQTVANYIFKKIGGMRFRPLDATLLSNPLIESGDVALVTDRKQNTYSCFISNRTFTVGSGTKISCDAENASRNSADKFSSETKAVVQAREVAQAQLSVYDKQMQLLTQLMSQSLGLFKTEQKQEDGSIIYIMHNKSDLKSSNIQWKMTANGMAVSSDYGKTWNAGIDKDGNAIFNIMSAIGINFDWAHGGTFTLGGENNVNGKQYVKDANGKTLVTLDNKGITLDSSVKIAWDNVADTTAKVTQITKDTVTSKYVSALEISANAIKTGTLTGVKIQLQSANDTGTLKISVPKSEQLFSITGCNIYGYHPNGKTTFSAGNQDEGFIDLYDSGGDTNYKKMVMLNPGMFFCSGTKSRLTDTEDYDKRLLYCYEMPSPMFGDIGEATLDETGKCLIYLDDIFAETIDTECKYQVFLQKYGKGDCYILNRNSAYFEVEGTPNLKFGWEVKAIQKEYDTLRFERFNVEEYKEKRDNTVNNIISETTEYMDNLLYSAESEVIDYD